MRVQCTMIINSMAAAAAAMIRKLRQSRGHHRLSCIGTSWQRLTFRTVSSGRSLSKMQMARSTLQWCRPSSPPTQISQWVHACMMSNSSSWVDACRGKEKCSLLGWFYRSGSSGRTRARRYYCWHCGFNILDLDDREGGLGHERAGRPDPVLNTLPLSVQQMAFTVSSW